MRRGTFGGIRTAIDLFEAIAGHGSTAGSCRSAGTPRAPTPPCLPTPRPQRRGPCRAAPTGRPRPTERAARRSVRTTSSWRRTGRRPSWSSASGAGRRRRTAAAGRFGYVIQDFEPGSSRGPPSGCWRARHIDASAETVAIFNTSLLRDHFHASGIAFEHEFAFEPRLSPTLRGRDGVARRPARGTIVVYGRPGMPRNAFPAIVDGLRAWRAATRSPTDGGRQLGRRRPPRYRTR